MSFNEGNKAINLRRLRNGGFNVPSFIVVPPDIQKTELIEQVNTQMPRTKIFAVRSSSFAEDTEEKSEAGKFYSAIAVKKENLFNEYARVLESYAKMKSGVILQQFIPSDKSGILFTDNGSGKAIINASFGLCKYVVEGKSCDEYVLNSEGTIINKYISAEKECLYHGTNSFKVAKTKKSSLSDKEIRELFNTGKQIQRVFGDPQDIEWCYFRKKLIILQTRSITRPVPDSRELIHYDSANIAESYSGIILPLTLSFARHIYQVVYENLLHASGVRRKKLLAHRQVFENMIDWFYGRLYYNMNNWYRMMAFIPGYRRNKMNLENMITSNIRLNIERTILPPLSFKLLYPLIVVLKLLWFGRSQGSFEKRVKKYLGKYRRHGYFNKLTFEECRVLYQEFDRKLISKWHIPVENDFMVMTFFGLLQKHLSAEKLQEAVRFASKTGKQIENLIHVKNAVYSDSTLKEAVEENNTEHFKTALIENRQVLETLETYYSEYGGRFANELKLESADIEEDFDKLTGLLKLYKDKEFKPDVRTTIKNIDSPYIRFLVRRFRKYAAQRESMRLLRSNGFSLVRKLFKKIGIIYLKGGRIGAPEDIFYLTVEEVFENRNDYSGLIAQRKLEYMRYHALTPPAFFTLAEGDLPYTVDFDTEVLDILQGRACNTGIVKGRVRVFKEFSLPGKIDFDIVVARNTDPGWTPLIGIARGLIVEHGGILSHAAIVSRELGIPTVIGVENAVSILKTGMMIELDGNKGLIKLIHED